MIEFKGLVPFAIRSVFYGMPNYHFWTDNFQRILTAASQTSHKKAQGESGWDVQDDVDRMLLRTVVTARTEAADSFILRV